MKPPLLRADMLCVRALSDGSATKDQQMRALAVIVNQLCQTNDASYAPTDRDTAFNEGRRDVGLKIRKIAEGKASKIFDIVEGRADERSD